MRQINVGQVDWNRTNQLKFMLAKSETERLVIQDAIDKSDMHTHYKTIKHYKRDLHNKVVEIRNLKKELRKCQLSQ